MQRWKKGTLKKWNGIVCAKFSMERFVFGKQQKADEAKIILVGSMEDGKSRDRLETGEPGRRLSQ